MEKVYVISYEDYCNGSSEYCSGVSYVFKTLKGAREMLEIIKKDEIENYKINGVNVDEEKIKELGKYGIEESEDEFTLDLGYDYTTFKITEMQLRG